MLLSPSTYQPLRAAVGLLKLTDRLVASTNASLNSNATIWSRIKKKVDWDAGAPPPNMNVPMGIGPVGGGGIPGGGQVMRQRFLTLCYGDMETIKNLPSSYAVSPSIRWPPETTTQVFLLFFQEAEAIAREWVKPPPDASFHLRVPVEYASLQASVGHRLIMIHGPLRLPNLHSDSFKGLGYGYVYFSLSYHFADSSQISSDEAYQIAISGVHGLRLEIVTDAPPPPECV